MPSQYIYLLRRSGRRNARMVMTVRVDDMRKAEKIAHQTWGRYRRNLTEGAKTKLGHGWYKIGLSSDPQRRLVEINNDIFQSGDTEWFLFPSAIVREVKSSLREMELHKKGREHYYSLMALWIAVISILIMITVNLYTHEEKAPEKESTFRKLVDKSKR